MIRALPSAVVVLMLTLAGTACASKKFVRTSVAQVNDKADAIGRSLEETQERTRQNEAKIADVNRRTEAAGTAAATAQGTADRASVSAADAARAAAAVGARAEAMDKASRRLVYEVVLSDAQGNFEFGRTDLPEEAKTRLDAMIAALRAEPKAVYFEIAGYTDSIGSAERNEKLGLERAEAVKRYLHEKHQVPLHKVNAISFGEDNPVADNKTKAGRAQNRRVVIRVVS